MNNTQIYWDKRAEIYYRTELDIKYWQQSTFLARINGVVYENYIKWIDKYLQKHKTFIPQSICSNADKSSCFTQAHTWETFLYDSLEVLSQLAVQMHAIIPPRASEVQVLSNTEPTIYILTNTSIQSTNLPPIAEFHRNNSARHAEHHHRNHKTKKLKVKDIGTDIDNKSNYVDAHLERLKIGSYLYVFVAVASMKLAI
eukprot:gene17300-22837_t